MTRSIATASLFALIAGLTLVFTASPAGACSCATADNPTAFADADAVFVGTPTEIFDARGGPSTNPEVVIIEVDEVYKGDVIEQQGVVTRALGASCGYEFEVGVPVVVFGSLDRPFDDMEDGFYGVELCDGTRPLAEATLDFGTPAQLPNLGEPPDTATIQAQLGNPRPSLLPEALIFVGVLVGILGLASAFTLRDRRRAAS